VATTASPASAALRWAEVALETTPQLAETCAFALTEAGCAGAAIHDEQAASSDPYADWLEADPSRVPPSAARRCEVRGHLPVDDRLEPALTRLTAVLRRLREAGLTVPTGYRLRHVSGREAAEWATAWRAHYRPFRVGRRLVVKPTWEPWEARPGDLVLELDPGMAFGTGSHPSTALCLELMEDCVRPGDRVLDWGAGSGILALAALLLGAAQVTAVDRDPVAVRVCGENLARSVHGMRARSLQASIEELPADERFDLILANLVADPIIGGSGEMARRLRPGGRVIASGVVAAREAEVCKALEGAGLQMVRTAACEEWRAFLAARLSPPR
jgi:ribosomal protein L11 methyltransferase